MKKFAFTLLLLSVLSALLLRGCVPKTSARVIRDFRCNRNSFAAVAEYIESGSSAAYAASGKLCTFGFRDWKDADTAYCDAKDFTAPEASRKVKRAVRRLFHKLGYDHIERNDISNNTIFFETKYPPLCWDMYYNQGVCYVIDGGEPTPEDNWDYCTENTVPIGGNWYYWCGHCYFG